MKIYNYTPAQGFEKGYTQAGKLHAVINIHIYRDEKANTKEYHAKRRATIAHFRENFPLVDVVHTQILRFITIL